MSLQLDLFETNDDLSLVKRDLQELKSLMLKTVRSQYAKIGELEKKCDRQASELELLRDYYNPREVKPQAVILPFSLDGI